MKFILQLKSIAEKEAYGLVGNPIRHPFNYDAYGLEYYVRGYLLMALDETHLLNPAHHWPVLFLATGFTSTNYFLEPLDAGQTPSLDIPEGSYSIRCHRRGDIVTISEPYMTKFSGEVDYDEFRDITRRFAEDVRTTLLEMNQQFAEHTELGAWFRTPQS